MVTPWASHGPKQETVLFSDKRIVLLACGVQFGKTIAGAVRMKMAMHTFIRPEDNFLIMAPTYKVLAQSTLPPFLRIMEGFGTYSRADATFKMSGGGTCYFRTATDPDSIVGITNIRHIWLDEAGLFSLYAWENVLARAAFRKATIVLTTSPYSLNWIFKEMIRPRMRDKKARPDVDLVQARSDENPYFPKEEYEARKKTMSPRRFNMMFGGQWDKAEGLVYDCFDEQENICDPFDLPSGTRIVAGVDWGYTNPFVILVRAITPQGMHYQISEFYRTQLTIDQKVEAGRRLKSVYGIEMFYCDPANPDDIESFNRAKLPAIGADNSLQGIDRHYELIKTRRYKLFRGSSPHTEDELSLYHWAIPEDVSSDKDMKERGPVKQDEHCLDAARYTTVMTYLANKRLIPVVPEDKPKEESHVQRAERLKKRRQHGGNSEEWSA